MIYLLILHFRTKISERAAQLARSTPAVLEAQPKDGNPSSEKNDKKSAPSKKPRRLSTTARDGGAGAKKQTSHVNKHVKTRKSEAEKYRTNLKTLGLSEDKGYSYVAGHCFFSSFARASVRFDKANGAHIVRGLCAGVYNDSSSHPFLRPWLTEGLAMQCRDLRDMAESIDDAISYSIYPDKTSERLVDTVLFVQPIYDDGNCRLQFTNG